MTQSKASQAALQAERQEAIDHLKTILKPGQTVYTVLRHVARSGMMRHISLLVAHDNKVIDITWYAARATGSKQADDGGIKMGGCGMDMGFALVYDLGRALWPNGTPEPHGVRNGEPDSDGGYALKKVWL